MHMYLTKSQTTHKAKTASTERKNRQIYNYT